ncbi:MAG: hypothetical protein Q9191_000296 [Dirinaria sp. TL-2023a]
MASSTAAAVAAFIDGAPPGELADVVADIKALTASDPKILESAQPAFRKYNEEQLATVKLPGSSQNYGWDLLNKWREKVLVSSYNSLDGSRYYDVESQSVFAFNHTTQVGRNSLKHTECWSGLTGSQAASAVQSHSLESRHTDLIKSLLKTLSIHAREHFPASTYSVFPSSADDSTLAILLVANKYSPSNFWNGRWRSIYTFDPSSSSLSGTIKVDVHYYEDGNVRLTTSKPVANVSIASSSGSLAVEVMKQVAAVEKRYQEELNRGFAALSENSFKSLRRQLPVTRQKVEWEKVGGYRLGQDIGGGRQR